MNFSGYYPDYFTAKILKWKHLLKPDKYKDIIISSLEFLVNEKAKSALRVRDNEQSHTFDMANTAGTFVAAGLWGFAEDYLYSSASFYKKASNTWPFLLHCQV